MLAYPWSSFPWYLAGREHRPRWLRVERLLGEHGIAQDTPAGRQELERHLERRRLEGLNEAALAEFRQAWSIGREAFRQKCLQRMEGKVGENHPGELRRESGKAKAQRMIGDELARTGWSPADDRVRRKGDPLTAGAMLQTQRLTAHRQKLCPGQRRCAAIPILSLNSSGDTSDPAASQKPGDS